LDTIVVKETLQSKLDTGIGPAVDFLYNNYSSPLYGYILQFVPDKGQAEKVLVLVFRHLAARLQEACHSPLSVYCWMQVEARKVILEYKKQATLPVAGPKQAYYLRLLSDASEEHKTVFSELFLEGRDKEELANQLQKTVHDVNRLLNESLLIMRKNLQ
jgi:hypothetical protein